MSAPTQPLGPLYSQLVQAAPTPGCAVAVWRGGALRESLMGLDDAFGGDAERRVLLLQNPRLQRPAATHTLVAGLQLLLPGERAPSHRHSQAGVRLMLAGRSRMHVGSASYDVGPGDLVVLPPMAAHSHDGVGDEPALWLDVLDVPTICFLRATFSDESGATPEATPPPGALHGLEEALAALPDGPHPALGRARRYRSADGGDVLPVIRATLHAFPPGTVGARWRSTASTVWGVLSGEGTLSSEGTRWSWGAHDVFVTPNWTPFSIDSGAGAVLVSLSDAALLDALGLHISKRA